MRRQFQGFGADESDCTSNQHFDDASQSCICNSTDNVMVGGVCKDKSTMCGPGTQWVDADQACVALTKYMSQAQIDAAKKAGVDLTGKGTVIVATPVKITAPAPPKSSLASLFGGANGIWLVGGAMVGIGLLALIAKKSEREREYR